MILNEVNVYELEMQSERASEIAKIHKNAFPKFFLTQLGTSFLTTLYQGYIEDEESGVIVAEKGDQIVGFIAYSKNYSRFFSELKKKHLIKFAFCSAIAVIKHPSFFRRLLGAFKKSDEVKRAEKYVELASIGVLKSEKSQGIGSTLINYLISETDFSLYSYISLETDAVDNEAAIHFYEKNGFVRERMYETREGRKMYEYRFSGEKKNEEDSVC